MSSFELKVKGKAVPVVVVPPGNNELECVIGDRVKENRVGEVSAVVPSACRITASVPQAP